MLLDTRARQPETDDAPPPQAKFVDLFGLALCLFLLLATLAVLFLIRGRLLEAESARQAVRELRGKEATLRQRIDAGRQLLLAAEADAGRPHPESTTRDQQVIGDHVDVTWKYRYHDRGMYVNYEIELIRISPGRNQSFTGQCSNDLAANFQDPEARKNCPWSTRFMATDPGALRSRILPDVNSDLPPGQYLWRVAPVTANRIEKLGQEDDDARRADWSGYRLFEIYPSIRDRISQTRRIRVGTNFEQDTNFSRRGPDGQPEGFDISLARAIVEGCLALDRHAGALDFKEPRCADYVRRLRSDPRPPPPAGGPESVSVQFVPVGRWGDWLSMLKRKEIDAFIGSVTRARGRERSGVTFTRGYFPYQTEIYTIADIASPHVTLSSWLTRRRTIGVIENSTNDWLAGCLTQAYGKETVTTLRFPSYPALESAMDRGDIDGLIIDGTFVSGSKAWTSLAGWKETPAYRSCYLADPNHVGFPREELAIATAIDGQDQADPDHALVTLFNRALASAPLRSALKPICEKEWRQRASICRSLE
ncbi:MAG TPA: transporter substrate-binding domain-containing protein [Bryobacteraceae bacterium]|nr:transporter substrate-binding domain-containing protein [Bryobacteraceae bacterium]